MSNEKIKRISELKKIVDSNPTFPLDPISGGIFSEAIEIQELAKEAFKIDPGHCADCDSRIQPGGYATDSVGGPLRKLDMLKKFYIDLGNLLIAKKIE